MGTSHSKEINSIIRQIWEWCISHSIWIAVSHIPEKENTIADRESRKQRRETEWTLDTEIFDNMLIGFQSIFIYLLILIYLHHRLITNAKNMSHINQTREHMQFHLTWKDFCFSAFHPFCIIQKVLRKVTVD